MVEVDDDLGVSAARTSRQRIGFQGMIADMALGKIGLVLALEVSRLSRSNRDWYHLLDICAITSTLIADGEGLYDPRSYNDRLLLGLKATMSEAALISPEKWKNLLANCGFPQTISFEASKEKSILSRQSVIVSMADEGNKKNTNRASGNWLIFADNQGTGEKLAELLTDKKETCTLVFKGESYKKLTPHRFQLNPKDPNDFIRLFNMHKKVSLTHVVHLWSLDATDSASLTIENLQKATQEGCVSVLHLVQALCELPKKPSLRLVTRGAQPAGKNINL